MRLRTRIHLRQTLRRLALLILTPLALLLALRLLWGWEADHRLAKTKADLLAAGIHPEPPTVSIPDDQNAALAVFEACNALDRNPAEDDLVYDGDSPRGSSITWTDDHKPLIRAVLDRNAPAFRWIRIASQCTGASWPAATLGTSDPNDHHLSKVREIGMLLRDAAQLAHDDHNDRAAIDNLILLLALARTVDTEPAEISHLVAVALRAVACSEVECLEPDLQLSQADGSLSAARSLLTALLDDQPSRQAHAAAWEAEIRNARILHEAPFAWEWWIRPLLRDVLARYIHGYAAELPSVQADNWQAAKSLLPKVPSPDFSNLNLLTLLNETSYNPSEKYSLLHYRSLSDSAAAATLLAARIYQSQNHRLPSAAEQLVPAVLPRLPVDPFAADHRPMRYRLDPQGPTVWSVNENGTDEGGSVLLDPSGYRHYNRYGGSSDPAQNPKDIIYGAAWRVAAPPPPATSPALTSPYGAPPVMSGLGPLPAPTAPASAAQPSGK